ncbi:type VI secretion system-associated FHA domain protein [Xenorhabdus littoralis]|uniref:type VI secretion system-associated FHA domain protein n=1 Tax=Xenorhabdus littoralis TaxID=2582835 RepID=UPI0029E81E1D|nr:type VI secretion system-associated FHA domain protein [Xenorhabdus sp. psl]MDX7990436.1 type VI secretion system-associated FHA domain protein TagH [Xenorhabdus sp. psl]
MRFTIIKNIGINRPPQLSYDFIPPGGTMGRSTENNWVLPGEEHAIARLQAIVSISADGGCRITNRGAASEVLLNTIPMAPDRQIEVCDGDVLNIGDYQIQVVNIAQSAPPLAETHILNTIQPQHDKLKNIPSEVWDGLESKLPTANATSVQNTQPVPQELNDNNPLITPQQYQERNPIDPLEQMESKVNLNTLQIDATDPITMFNSDSGLQQENILNDTTPSTLLQQNKQEVDPLALFSDQHARDIKHDDLLSLMLGKAEPLASLDDSAISESQEIRDQDDLSYYTQTSSPPLSPLFATEDANPDLTSNLTDSDHLKQSHYKNSVSHQYHDNNNDNDNDNDKSNYNNDYDCLNIEPMSYRPDAPFPHQTDKIQLEGKLLSALLDGMGLNNIKKPQFDEHAIYQLGKLLSQLSQGIVALNASCSRLKHEINADMTKILPDNNNPFKLLPSGQAVLTQMFGDHIPGFMSPEKATRDILIELQAHQLGMIAGLHAMTADILRTFEPDVIEKKAHEEIKFPRLSLSSTSKSYLWDYLIKYYQTIVHTFEKDHVLFGENFLQAYETEVERYRHSQDKLKK